MLGLGIVFLVHAGLAISERGRSSMVRLEEPRTGAVDEQESERSLT
jgi:hypothetical protein